MKKIAAALLLSALAAPAFSADIGSLASSPDQGFYAGITVGPSKTDSNIGTTVLTKTSGTVYGILGGYQFTRNFAVEAQFTGAGNFEATPVTAKNDSLSLSAVGSLPVTDAVSLYAKLGIASTRTSLSGNTPPTGGTSRSAATYGVGAQYNVTPVVGLRLGWDHYGSAIKDVAGTTQNFNSSTWTIGALYKF